MCLIFFSKYVEAKKKFRTLFRAIHFVSDTKTYMIQKVFRFYSLKRKHKNDFFSRVEIHPKKWGWKINIEEIVGLFGEPPYV